MATFTYRARNNAGQVFTGTIEGDNREIVIDRLREMKYFIISVDKKSQGLLSTEITLFQTVKVRDLAIFYRQFATMVSAGLTLVNCLEILSRQTENKLLAKKIDDIKKSVERGSTLADAFAAILKHFPSFTSI